MARKVVSKPRKNLPKLKAIADARGLPDDSCWACGGRHRSLERAHIVAHRHDGSDTDPRNFMILCKPCHHTHPDDAPEWVQWVYVRTMPGVDERRMRFARGVCEAVADDPARADEFAAWFEESLSRTGLDPAVVRDAVDFMTHD